MKCSPDARRFRRTRVQKPSSGILGHEPDWTRLPESTPALVRHVLRRCLEKDANRRLHDIADARVESRGCAVEQNSCCRGHQAPTPVHACGARGDSHRRRCRCCGRRTVAAHVCSASVNSKVPIPSGSATADPGRLLGPPVVSPDGSTVVVSLSVGKQSGLFCTAARFGSARAARWHPRRRVSLLVARQQNHRVLRRRQAQNRTGRWRNRGHAVLGTRSRGGAWSRQGTIILGINFRGVFRCDQQSGEPVEITRLDASLVRIHIDIRYFFPTAIGSCITRAPTTLRNAPST